MESQPAAQGLEVSDRCPCDDGRPDECPHVANAEIVGQVQAVQGLTRAVVEASLYLTFQEVSEVVSRAYSIERA